MKKGKLIIIESGSDASGKATQSQKLYERLVVEGIKVKKVSYPNYDSESSALVKMYLNGEFGKNPNDVDPYVASTFFACDRYATYKKEWQEFLNNGGVVIADRYTTSNMVHQAAKMSAIEKEKFLDWLWDFEFNMYKLPVPDAVMFLNMPPEVSQKLMENRANKITGESKKDIHESNKKYLIDSYNTAIEIAKKYSWKNINCTINDKLRSIEEIHEEIYDKVKDVLDI